MSTEIFKVTSTYSSFKIGEKINNILLQEIRDESINRDNLYIPIYVGYSNHHEIVFKIINQPVSIEYFRD